MTAQQLKNSILQMAVQGKLVPQDPNDEPASVLIQKICKEKEQMIRDGKIKKEKNPSFIFRGEDDLFYEKIGNKEPVCIEDEVPFEIPDNWEWVRLCNICSILNGDRGKNYPSKSKLSNKGIPFISALNLNGKGVNSDENLLCLTEDQYNKLGGGKLQINDIVICIRGSLGKHGKYPFERGAIASSLVIARLFQYNDVLSSFIMLFLDSPLFFQEIKKYDNGTAQPNLSAKSLEKFLIPFPPLKEQARIVNTIERIQDYITQYDHCECTLNLLNNKFPSEMKNSLRQIAVQGELVQQDPNDEPASALIKRIHDEKEQLIKDGKIKRDKHESGIYKRGESYYENVDGIEHCIDDEIPYEIPKSWEWVRLGNYVEKVTDQVASGSFASLRANVPSLKEPDYAIMVKTADFSNGFTKNLTYTTQHGYEFLHNSNLFGGELILSNIGSVGKCFIVPKLDCKMTLAPNSVMVKPVYEELRDYLYNFMLSPQGYQELIQITSGTATKKFNKTDLKTILIPVPPIQEQKRIVTRLNQVMGLCDKLS